jgi:hypothetical protein
MAMLTRLFNLLAIVSIGTLLAVGGIVGFLGQQGHLTGDRLQLIAEVVRGEHDDLLSEEVVEDPNAGIAEEPVHAAGRSAEALRAKVGAQRLLDAKLERTLNNVVAQKRLLDQAMQELLNREESFASAQERWKSQRDKLQSADEDAGFQEEVTTVQSLDAAMAKEHLTRKYDKSPADAVRLFRALPVSNRKRILAELTTPRELDLMHELLEQLSNAELAEFAP